MDKSYSRHTRTHACAVRPDAKGALWFGQRDTTMAFVHGATLAIAEGFETADAFTRLNDIPCWASLGARRLDQLVIPTSVTTLFIAEDNDPEGRRAAVQAQEEYARDGLDIRRFPPPPKFKDWAKVLDGQSLLQTRS